MKKLLLLLALLFAMSSYAQFRETISPDYKKIRKQITKKKSNLFYKKLMTRYKMSDPTLTIEEKRHLYYGYVFQDTYTPFEYTKYRDSLILYSKKKTFNKKNLYRIIVNTNKVLRINPFDLSALKFQVFAFKVLKLKADIKYKKEKIKIIEDALLSSGDGLFKNSAYCVINTSHELEIIDMIGYEYAKKRRISAPKHEYLNVLENNQQIEGLYFDVTPCLHSVNDSKFK